MRVLLTKMRDLQGFQRKKRPCKISLARSIFLLWFYKLGLPQIKYRLGLFALDGSLCRPYVRQGKSPLPP